MMYRIAVIQFPGSNCEYETARMCQFYGFSVDILRWTCDESIFQQYDAYILPGGFSYQDRVRAGAVAAKLPILDYLVAASEQKKPILGICNGCQILAESGLIPGLNGDIAVGLAPNTRDKRPLGFVCDWTYVKVRNPHLSLFTSLFKDGDVLPIPVNHGEGRFVISDTFKPKVSEFILFQYCTENGEIDVTYPINPNGAYMNIAGMSNQQGNVLAMMPHPERSAFLRQIPYWIEGEWSKRKRDSFSQDKEDVGPWHPLFMSLKAYLDKEVVSCRV